MAQQIIILFDRETIVAISRILSSESPEIRSMSFQWTSIRWDLNSLIPIVCFSINAVSIASFSTKCLAIPLNRAESPLMRMGTWSSAIVVPVPSIRSISCGCLNRFIPVSSRGLMLITDPPLRLHLARAESIRG